MFDQILQLVKEHLNNNQEVSSAIPADKVDAVHNEVAQHITDGIKTQGGMGDIMSMLKNSISSGGTATSAIEGGLVSSLASKFGLSPLITGAIAGALPGILQKFVHKANDPNDSSITADSITKSIGNSGLGSLFNK